MNLILLTSIMWLGVAGCGNQTKEKGIENTSVSISPKVIYGEDDRIDWYQNSNSMYQNLAASTAALIDDDDLTFDDDKVTVSTRSLNLCPSEPFADQVGGPWCSGFLVGPNLMVTAGHCLQTQSDCENTSFIFDFAMKSEDHDPSVLTASDVYECTKLIDRDQVGTGADWALVEVDRVVIGRTPLTIRPEGDASVGDELTVIGHPSGLPSKIAPGAIVREIKNDYLVASADTYGGNSGSAVFNSETGEVEGILVRGERDYIFENGCRKSNVCKQDECRGEDITLISVLRDLINEQNEPSDGDGEDDGDDSDPEQNPYISTEELPILDTPSEPTMSVITSLPEMDETAGLEVRVKLKHSYVRDISIVLISPSGAEVMLQDRDFQFGSEFHETFGKTKDAEEDLADLGEQPAGEWTLKITDHSRFAKGTLLEWEIILP